MKIRVSIATASLLKLKDIKIDALPSTLYFLLPGKCKGACGYCFHRKGYLARVPWPEFEIDDVVKRIKHAKARRICIQTVYNDETFDTILAVLEKMPSFIPLSVAMNPMEREKMIELKNAGVERVGIGIDAASRRIFKKWKKNVGEWNDYISALKDSKEIFGKATAHLIIGLGESDREAIDFMEKMKMEEIDIALFALVMKGKTIPSMERYRAMQIARYAIFNGKASFEFDGGRLKKIYADELKEEAFRTSGCPHCNRPFYNERPTKIYNYPYPLSKEEFERAIKEAEKYAELHIAAE
ncbi:MAG: radical SAM protein [Thermoplasmata archaeon]|nr:radical SAM protein [Thermoplasmata archaeon]